MWCLFPYSNIRNLEHRISSPYKVLYDLKRVIADHELFMHIHWYLNILYHENEAREYYEG